MKTQPLYRYTREDGGVSISPQKPEGEYTELVRIIADKDKAITKDGVNFYTVIDDASVDGYYDVEKPEETADEEEESEV